MINLIKKWREKRRRKRILKIIKDAKQYYLDKKSLYMCLCFGEVYARFYRKDSLYENIHKMIPEFNREIMGAVYTDNIWWDIIDRESRIKAFDKLIEIYDDTRI